MIDGEMILQPLHKIRYKPENKQYHFVVMFL